MKQTVSLAEICKGESYMIRYDRKKECCNVPYSVNISVTEKCPLKCPFCFHEYDNDNELSVNQVYRYIDELASMGTAQIQFSGGEPLIYPHILEVISYAHSKGIRVVISTSGVTITEQYAKELKDRGLDCCYISLNGSTAEIHEITRDGYEFTINALKIFKEIGLVTAINWVAGHDNINDLEKLIGFAKNLGVRHISVIPMKRSGRNNAFQEMTKEDLGKLIECFNRNKGYIIAESCFDSLIAKKQNFKSVSDGCRAGKFYMSINAKGSFLCCPHLLNSAAVAPSIEEYWNNDEYILKFRQYRECPCLTILV